MASMEAPSSVGETAAGKPDALLAQSSFGRPAGDGRLEWVLASSRPDLDHDAVDRDVDAQAA